MRTHPSPATTTVEQPGRPRPAVLGTILRRTAVTALAAALITGPAAFAFADSTAAPNTHAYADPGPWAAPNGDPGGW